MWISGCKQWLWLKQPDVERTCSSWVEEGRRWEWRVTAQHNPPSFQPLMRNPILRNWAPVGGREQDMKSPLMAEWRTQQPEPKWSPKDSGREERHGTYVNGHPVQKAEQEMEPLRAVMEPLERKMKCKWREKVSFKDVDGHPLGLKCS